MVDKKEKPYITIGITHNGTFHADDVFSTALLKILYPNIKIVRVSEVKDTLMNNENTIVYDIGGGKYDHHNMEIEKRTNGVEYSSFGKLWRDFGQYLLDDFQSIIYIDSVLVQEIDKTDNGRGTNPLSAAIKVFNVNWNDNETKNEDQFDKAVNFAQEILENFIAKKKAEKDADKVLEDAYKVQRGGIIVLNNYIPINPTLKDGIYYIIYPSNREGYNINTVVDKGTNKIRKPLPLDWYNKAPKGMRFIHRAGILANFDTIYNALDAAQSALKNNDITCIENPIITKLKENNWSVIDTNYRMSFQIDAIDILSNGEITGSQCLSYNGFSSINPLYIKNNSVFISSKDSYGFINNSTEIDNFEDEITEFNNRSDNIKIVKRIMKDGTIIVPYTNNLLCKS